MKDTIRILLLIGLVTVQANESQSKTQMADWPYYQIIVNSNLFHPLRWRPSSTKPKYELIATKILSGGSSKALIRETNSNKTYYVGIGDQIQGTKVEKIEENQVRLNIGNKPISLSGGGLQFLSLDQEHRNKRKGAKERSKNRRRNEGDQSQKGKNKSEKNEERNAGKILVELKVTYKNKQTVGLTGQKLPPLQNAVPLGIAKNSGIYHQKYRVQYGKE